jgi:hypothetical protein
MALIWSRHKRHYFWRHDTLCWRASVTERRMVIDWEDLVGSILVTDCYFVCGISDAWDMGGRSGLLY